MFSSPAQRRKSSMMAGRQGSRDFAFGRAGSRELGGGSKAIARMSFSSRGSSSSAPGRDTAEPEITTSITEEVATIDESRRAHPWAPATTTALTAGTVGAPSGGSAKVAPELSVTQASGSVKSEVSVAAPEPSRRRPSVTIPMEPVVPPQSPEMERRPSILPSFTHAVASGVQRGLRRVQSELSLAPRSDNGGEGGENKIRSISMRAIFERLVENPAGVKKILDSADADDDDAQRAAKRARNDKAAPSDAVVVE